MKKKAAAYLSKGLKESGYRGDLAENGEEGIHLATQEAYDVAQRGSGKPFCYFRESIIVKSI